MKLSVGERFWSKVDIRGPGACWEWTAALNSGGYGVFIYPYRPRPAHRVLWILMHGSIPDGARVLHRCDNRACVNPAHLFLGTQKDNIDDATRKGRMARKLTEEQVREIRRLHATYGMKYATLADEFGVTPKTIGNIVRGETWRHLL